MSVSGLSLYDEKNHWVSYYLKNQWEWWKVRKIENLLENKATGWSEGKTKCRSTDRLALNNLCFHLRTQWHIFCLGSINVHHSLYSLNNSELLSLHIDKLPEMVCQLAWYNLRYSLWFSRCKRKTEKYSSSITKPVSVVMSLSRHCYVNRRKS